MQELQARAERFQHENDHLRSHVEKSLKLGKDMQEGDRAEPPIVCNKGKEHVISGDGDTSTDDELSSVRPPSMSPPPKRNARGSTRAKSQRKHSHCPALSDVVSGASCLARE